MADGQMMNSFQNLRQNPVVKYGVITSLISCIFGLILFVMTAELVIYGNYNNALGGFVPIYFYFMSITASLLAAYRASRGNKDKEGMERSKKQKALSGMLTALIVSLLPVVVYACLALTIVHDMIFGFMIALQFCFVPLPAAILGGLIGYFIKGNPETSLKGYTLFLSSVLLLELAVFLILIYGAVWMGFVPYDPGRVMVQ